MGDVHIYIRLTFDSLSTKSSNYLSSSTNDTQIHIHQGDKMMLPPNAKLLSSSAKFLPSPVEPPQHIHRIAGGASPSLERNCKLSRRNLSKSSLLLLLTTQTTLTPLLDFSNAQADTIDNPNPTNCENRVRQILVIGFLISITHYFDNS